MPLCKCGCGKECQKNYKRGHGRKGTKNTLEHNLAISKANTGRKLGKPWNFGLKNTFYHTEKTKLEMSTIAKERGFGKWMFGRYLSQDTKNKMGRSRRDHTTSNETREKIGIANSGIKNGCYGRVYSDAEKQERSEFMKEQWKNPIYRQNQVNQRLDSEFTRRGALLAGIKLKSMWYYNTKPELKMLDILEKLKISFIHTYPVWNIKHMWCADFYIPNINTLIEVDGKYWHNYPTGRSIDHLRDNEVKQLGYKILRFWDDEVLLNNVEQRLFGGLVISNN